MIGGRIIKLLEKLSGKSLKDAIDSIQPYYNIVSYQAGLQFKKSAKTCKNVESFFNLVDNFRYSLSKNAKFIVAVKLYQKKEEIIAFIKLYWKIKPKRILEIGTYDGGTLSFLSRYAQPDATLYTMDLPLIRDGAGYTPAKIPFYNAFKQKHQKIHFIRDNSQAKSTVQKFERLLNGKKLDVLLIDGDHTYKGVKTDFANYSPFVKKGGIIAFHDIVEHQNDLKCKVHEFWSEIKTRYNYKEIISEKGGSWAGIGVLFHN
jgi:cephalosporin hydroxylase